ncbi:MAG: peptide ABC transporter permease [Geminicoccus sp.]|nr:peptide ABC transporter permease [Geminicoccus sp.]
MSLLNRERNEEALAAAGEVLRSRSLTQLAIARFLRNRVAVGATAIVIVMILLATFAPIFELLTGYEMDYQDRNFYSGKAPNWDAKHYFGTDQNGRDIFVRTMFGMRISMLVALVAASVALVIGVGYGAISGLAGGLTDTIMMRILDLLISYPLTLIAVIALAYFGRNIFIVFVIIGLVEWQIMARVIRGQVISLRNSDFIEAARAAGVRPIGILVRHIVPNVTGVAIVYMTLIIPEVILVESFLGYLGLGVQEPNTSLGVLISEGANSIERKPWMTYGPGMFLVVLLLALNFVGDGLRDAFDPKDR